MKFNFDPIAFLTWAVIAFGGTATAYVGWQDYRIAVAYFIGASLGACRLEQRK